MSDTRRIELDVVYQGKNISDYINKDLVDFSLSDSVDSSADTINITLQDIEENWLKNWIVEDGDKISVKAISYNWNKIGEKFSVNFGDFFVDDPSNTIKPNTFSLKAIAIPANGNFRDYKRTKIWKNATIKTIAQTIANNNGLSIYYDSSENSIIKEKEQSQTSDMEFLQSLCSDFGLTLKVYCSKLVIFSEAEYEMKPPKITITPDMLEPGATFSRSLTDSGYDKAILTYSKGDGKTIKASFTKPNAKGNKVLTLNDSVENQAEGLKLCKAKLREKNKSQYTASFSMPGISKLHSAETFRFKGVGQYDGIYYIDSKNQSFAPTSASFEAHKILGY